MATINPFMFLDTTNLASQPYDTNATAEQPWVNTKFSVYDSDIEVRSVDGFIFQLHRVVLAVSTGAFPGSEMDTGGEIVQLMEPASVLGILFGFLYPKQHPDLQGERFEMLAAVAEAAGKYEVFSAEDACNERLVKFVPQYAPEILVHAIKHDYSRLLSATLPHFTRAPLLATIEKLSPAYMLPWVRYYEAWTSLFKETKGYIKKIRTTTGRCHSSTTWDGMENEICEICLESLNKLVAHLEGIETLTTLDDTLQSPNTKLSKAVLKCCGRAEKCPFIGDVTAVCKTKIEQIPSFATFLGLKI
ncbi:hypothetical protein GALMADRAFT_105931 [Galerina marginata CBS 339.88]|uniref:BTB domain-containing protein n=1 Tax=Galerina marginata (strain CBS 339.88) TaxID=685588 RepID=A0A067S8W6_GALM3|nr:hypothetical protein GALMADRAFT_105931 [Galerina marginata CBS 339.88]